MQHEVEIGVRVPWVLLECHVPNTRKTRPVPDTGGVRSGEDPPFSVFEGQDLSAVRHYVRCSPRGTGGGWLGSRVGHGGEEHIGTEGAALSAYGVRGASDVVTCWAIGAG